ncbi:MAG: sigma 54-interacting transcriptional regulator [Peptococcaceae bacterium]|nr:sigma 54-interacting transcriptional regulator [Peptococcaceae bacterium]
MGLGTNAVTTGVIPQWDQKLLFKILDNIHDVVIIIDSDTTIVYANEAYARILGVPVHKVLGRRLDQIEPSALSIEVLRTGETILNRPAYLHSVGIDVVGQSFPLFEGKKIIGCVTIINSVSEVMRLNRELQLTKGVAEYLRERLDQFEQLPGSFQECVGQNSRLRETLHLAAKVARTDSTVLIRGESGVGKEVLARAIHNHSRRKDKPLIKVNCAAIPEELLESELFGFEDGAFTGARKGGKLGKFELAHGGTIFLDEIGDMSISMQAKILRVLQEKEFERVGGTESIKVNIRVIAATNRDLEKMIEEGTFRRDLYYRLNIVPLFLLPLRERKDDIPALAKYFLAQFSKNIGGDLILSPQTTGLLQSYDWPGNVRELQNVLEHASIICGGNLIEPRHLPAYLNPPSREDLRAQENIYDLKEAVANLERELITSALANSSNRSTAIQALNISRRAFYDKLRRYNIDFKKPIQNSK